MLCSTVNSSFSATTPPATSTESETTHNVLSLVQTSDIYYSNPGQKVPILQIIFGKSPDFDLFFLKRKKTMHKKEACSLFVQIFINFSVSPCFLALLHSGHLTGSFSNPFLIELLLALSENKIGAQFTIDNFISH